VLGGGGGGGGGGDTPVFEAKEIHVYQGVEPRDGSGFRM